KDALGCLDRTVAVAREEAVGQEADLAHRADAAAAPAGAGRFGSQLVALDAQWIVQLDLLARHVAGVGHQGVDGVPPVLVAARTVAALVDLDAYPVLAAVAVVAAVRRAHDVRRVAAGGALGQHRRQRPDDTVEHALDLRHARQAGTREVGIEDGA